MKTKRAVRQIFINFLAMAILFRVMPALSDELPSPATNVLELAGTKAAFESITNKIFQIVPGAVARWDSSTNAFYRIVLGHKADQPYKIQGRTKSNTTSEKTWDIKGPAPDGFSIKIRFRNGKYHETLGRPSEPSFRKAVSDAKRDFYSETVLTEFPEQNMYMVTDIQFGEKTDLEALGKVYALLQEAIGAAIKGGSSR